MGTHLSPQQRKALRDIGVCRTAALGGHIEECDHCPIARSPITPAETGTAPSASHRPAIVGWRNGPKNCCPFRTVTWSSLCPNNSLRWPCKISDVLRLVVPAVSETLQEIAADPRHLGAQIGFLAVLHTWSQNLLHHPHVHCVVPAGGLPPTVHDGFACRPKFFLPVQALSRLFRGKFLAFLRDALPTETRIRGDNWPISPTPLDSMRGFGNHEGRVGRLRKASVWRARTRVEVSGPLHPSGGHFQRSPVVARTGPGHFRWRDSKDGNRPRS